MNIKKFHEHENSSIEERLLKLNPISINSSLIKSCGVSYTLGCASNT